MAGKFTNMRYDKEAYDEQLSRSTKPVSYKLDPHYAVNCNPCFARHGPRAGQDNSVVIGQQIDVDSVLRGISKVNTKINRHQAPHNLDQYKKYTPRDCSPAIEPQSTRYTHPAFDIRGLTVPDMRFGYPLHDPQCQIFENFAVDTRLQAKDNHRSVWQVPLDQQQVLPKERLGKVKNCTVSVNCAYAPY
ncbi:hypothetical protein mvi_399 [Megavirus vitis]|uniref:Uncharacterized protein n=2 Tax=unclassified Megavirus TaxID=3068396 RepID=A0A2K9V872_9VIRU|nr:hypothetical protein c7_L497 [Megavirus courdo7]AUV58374.1 hypothetical protein [Bandra megavirus]AVL93759.1 hypothetical protein mvi_399 [Megavirus vitis]URM62279.1 hypothetical protein [Mimivirus sp.]